ncbi:MAG TPA: ATP-binding protein [Thermoleophilaceae bacterium]|nr:ATP-binding protein [Thermoleophilaceae bacterium]
MCGVKLHDSNGHMPPDPALTRRFPARPRAVSQARRAVGALALDSELRANLELVVSELVANSVCHAGQSAHDPRVLDAPIDLRVVQGDGEVHISVHDEGPGFDPQDRGVSPNGGKRGLVIVEALTRAWGVDCGNGTPGCTVWCTIDVGSRA